MSTLPSPCAIEEPALRKRPGGYPISLQLGLLADLTAGRVGGEAIAVVGCGAGVGGTSENEEFWSCSLTP